MFADYAWISTSGALKSQAFYLLFRISDLWTRNSWRFFQWQRPASLDRCRLWENQWESQLYVCTCLIQWTLSPYSEEFRRVFVLAFLAFISRRQLGRFLSKKEKRKKLGRVLFRCLPNFQRHFPVTTILVTTPPRARAANAFCLLCIYIYVPIDTAGWLDGSCRNSCKHTVLLKSCTQ